MKTYIGTKVIRAERAEKDFQPGYLVTYADGYESWSPKDVFESAYREVRSGTMTFGDAIFFLKQGKRVARTGWNGKGMWLAYSPGSSGVPADKFWASPNKHYALSQGGAADVLPCITMKTATGEILMGWLASQTDMLAEDWVIID